MSDKSISVGDIRFLGQSKIVVDAVYPQFHIVKVHYTGKNDQSFSVDADALSVKPDTTPAINLELLIGNGAAKA